MTKMTTEEAFIKVLQMHGIEHAFGISGSAFMTISDLFESRVKTIKKPLELISPGIS